MRSPYHVHVFVHSIKIIWFQNLKGTSNFIKSFFFDIIVKELKKKSSNKINIFLL